MVFILIWLFILGSAVGSFLNVVIDSATKGESVILRRSYCDHCRAKLSSFDLIPIVSFVGLGGRCRRCKKKISRQYPIVEAVSGFLFSFTFFALAAQGNYTTSLFLLYLFVISVLIVVAVVDMKFSLIPTAIVFLASVVTLFYNYFFLDSTTFVISVFSAFLAAGFFLALLVITKGKGMGSGDVPLAFLVGLVLGWPNTIISVFFAFVSGALVSLVLVSAGRKGFKQTIPFAPFIVFSTILVMFFGNRILALYLSLF